MIWTLFYYNSLPDMPEGCPFFSRDVMHRDFFRCNPTNTGHHKYPKFETMSYDEGCHEREVKKFLSLNDTDKYVVFYTRYVNQNKVVGYFKVEKTYEYEKPDKSVGLGFSACKEAILLPKNKCIPIKYEARGVPVSWGNSTAKKDVDKILSRLKNRQIENIADKYKNETKKIMNLINDEKGRKKILKKCEDCGFKSQCRWGTKSEKLEVLKKLYPRSDLKC